MNANELADQLDKTMDESYTPMYLVGEASKMLRKQDIFIEKLRKLVRIRDDKIELLKLQLHTTLTNRDLRTYDGKTEINNEPLAYALRKAQEK
jgi:hypothetical protein